MRRSLSSLVGLVAFGAAALGLAMPAQAAMQSRSPGVPYEATSAASLGTGTLTVAIYTYSSVPGQSSYVQVEASNDTSGCVVTNYAYDFGDGQAASGSALTTANHTWTSLGDFMVSVTVTDNCGNTTTAQRTHSVVENKPPTAVLIAAVNAKTPMRVYADAGRSYDCDPEYIDLVNVTWGDGTVLDAFWDLLNDCTAYSSYNWYAHDYTAPGAHTLHMTLTDMGGLKSTTVAKTVYSAQLAPDIEETNSAVKYSGTWAVGTCGTSRCSANLKQKYTSTAGSKATLTYKGTSADWVGSTGPNAGTAKVLVDGIVQGKVSLRSLAISGIADGRLLFGGKTMAYGTHTITIQQVSGRVNIDALRIHS